MSALIPSVLAPSERVVMGIPAPVWHAVLLGTALALVAWILVRRIALLRRGAPDPRTDRPGLRLRRLIQIGFGQARQPRYPVAGILHILIFFGFLVLSLRSLTLLGEGFVADFKLPGFSGRFGEIYASVKDWTALVVLVCCGVAAVRRLVVRPARYHDRLATRPHGSEAYLILGLIALLMVADAFYEGSALAEEGRSTMALPLASGAAALLRGASDAVLGAVHVTAFWVHNVALLAFLCLLPLSKHFHVITALPNVWWSNTRPGGSIKPARWGTEDLDDLDSLGVRRLEDLTWKHLLDVYSCTDCGRCSDNCPAYATGTPLSPRMLSIGSRDLAYAAYPAFSRAVEASTSTELVGLVLSEEAVWSCTTCGACEEACPVLIEYIDRIVDMRRSLVEDGRVPAGLQKALADTEKRGNPYGKMARKRGEWIKDEDGTECGVRLLKKGADAEALFFTDSCAAFDPRITRIARAFGGLLTRSGVDVGTLGKDEVDSGHEARRVGEEGLFELLRDKNEEALGELEFGRIVTTDPHAWNALRNDYDLDVPVVHHAEALQELFAEGRLTAAPVDDERVHVFHDPCYLGRHGGVYEAPREVLKTLGVKTAEMERSRSRSFCCGGGSLYLFHEGPCDARMGEMRLEMAREAGAEVVVTACPFCLINLEDAAKTSGASEEVEVIDLAELVARHVVSQDAP